MGSREKWLCISYTLAEWLCYHYDPVLATWEHFNLAAIDGSGIITITVAHDPQCPRGPALPEPTATGN